MDILKSLNEYIYKSTIGELRMMNKALISGDINYNTMKYLDLISLVEDCTATKLAGMLGISKPAVTIKVNEMLTKGLVVKRQSEEDKRVYYLELSPESAEIYRMYDEQEYRAVEAAKKTFTNEELKNFCQVLKLIASYYSFDGLNNEKRGDSNAGE